MTARVRFSSGLCIQYNDATYATRHAGFTDLLSKKDGIWIAQVPSECVIEWVHPCRIDWTRDGIMQDAITQSVANRIDEYRAKQRRAKARKAKRKWKR